MEVLIGVLALSFVLFVVLGVFVTVKVVRGVRRGVESAGVQVRRTVEENGLKARTAQRGPVGELARTRLELRSSINGARRALEAGVARDPSLQEALGLLERLHGHARALDAELASLMERDADKRRTVERLPGVREEVARIKESADSLRFAAQDRARQYDAEGLTSLREQIEIESGALRHWQGDPREQPGGHAASGQPQSPPVPQDGIGHGEPAGLEEAARRDPAARVDPARTDMRKGRP